MRLERGGEEKGREASNLPILSRDVSPKPVCRLRTTPLSAFSMENQGSWQHSWENEETLAGLRQAGKDRNAANPEPPFQTICSSTMAPDPTYQLLPEQDLDSVSWSLPESSVPSSVCQAPRNEHMEPKHLKVLLACIHCLPGPFWSKDSTLCALTS